MGHSVQNFFKRGHRVDTPRNTCKKGIIGYRFAKRGLKSAKRINLLKSNIINGNGQSMYQWPGY